MRRNISLSALPAVLILFAAIVIGQSPGQGVYRGDGEFPQPQCATSPQWELNGRLRSASLPGGLPDGEPFTFEQDPPILFPDSDGALTFRNLSVVGDFPTVQFLRVTRDAPSGKPETWPRVRTRAVNGQLISVFEPT